MVFLVLFTNLCLQGAEIGLSHLINAGLERLSTFCTALEDDAKLSEASLVREEFQDILAFDGVPGFVSLSPPGKTQATSDGKESSEGHGQLTQERQRATLGKQREKMFKRGGPEADSGTAETTHTVTVRENQA